MKSKIFIDLIVFDVIIITVGCLLIILGFKEAGIGLSITGFILLFTTIIAIGYREFFLDAKKYVILNKVVKE